MKNIAFAAYRLKINGIGGIVFDLAAQAVDLNVDGTFAAAIGILGKLVTGDGHAGTSREIA
jgi:hypothetical protein